MTPEAILALIGAVVIVITFVIIIVRKLPKRVKITYYVRKWREIQKLCKNKDDWSHAIIHADMLLDEVMVKKRIAGKTMGERLVSVHEVFTMNDKVWEAHKLANNLKQEGERDMNEKGVKDALIIFRQALRDMGAL